MKKLCAALPAETGSTAEKGVSQGVNHSRFPGSADISKAPSREATPPHRFWGASSFLSRPGGVLLVIELVCVCVCVCECVCVYMCTPAGRVPFKTLRYHMVCMCAQGLSIL